ncbi:MAG: hypothetical protein HZC36_05580 [Armatimonadetes bacterium]|nr:hypothetical protein [Armatimonadota bacterium]
MSKTPKSAAAVLSASTTAVLAPAPILPAVEIRSGDYAPATHLVVHRIRPPDPGLNGLRAPPSR